MIKRPRTGIILLLSLILVSFLGGEELPSPRYANAIVISIHQSPLDGTEVDLIKSRFPFGLYAWLSLSTSLTPNLPWHYDWTNASAGIQSFKDALNVLVSRTREKNVRLHLILCSGIARGLAVYREAKKEDIRNCSWYNDNKLASDAQVGDPNAWDQYIFGTFSRYARKLRANLEAKSYAVAAFLKQKMDEDPDTLIAVSGWGEAEMNSNRIDPTKNLQDYFCDYSPFAVLEFRDWISHTGMYDDVTGVYKGQGYAGGGAIYQGSGGLAKFNADFGTSFTTWQLRYFDWSLDDDFDANPTDALNADPHRIPVAQYIHGGMMPTSGAGFIEGGFDPPRSMMIPGRFLDLWTEFRQLTVFYFVKDFARWMSVYGVPSDRLYSHQIPADYLNGSEPGWPQLYARYYTSASPLWTADVRPFGSVGATIYDIKYPPSVFPDEFRRTSQYGVPALAAMAPDWAAMEYNAEVYPAGMNVAQSSPGFILDQYLRLYRYGPHLVNFYCWYDDAGEYRIKGMNKETALADFVGRIRDKARATDLNTMYDPPRGTVISGLYYPGEHTVRLELNPKIWSGASWEWPDWGDFSHFEIHRALVPNFTPGPATLLSTATSALFEDKSTLMGLTYFYKFRAVNKNQVAGPASNEVSVPVVNTQAPVLSVNRSLLYFGASAGGPATRRENVIIANSGPGVLNWQAAPSASWISVSAVSGTGNGVIEIAVNHAGLRSGSYAGAVTVTAPGAYNSPYRIDVELRVYDPGADAAPFGVLDTPVTGSHVYASVPVTGWALDDIEVKKIEIRRAPDPADPPSVIDVDGLVYIGDAVFVKGARPDVASQYVSYPRADSAGWGYMMLTNFLPRGGNGTFRLYAVAEDTSGRRVRIGETQVLCDNASSIKPFGTIDTPAQGGLASGRWYANFGWALTPLPKEIPRDGSTLNVWVDSLPVGRPVYNQYRQDIYDLFPGYKNRDGAVGYFYLDTTKLTNGVHTIAWSVVDDAGEPQGIGSRYFEAQNAGSASGAPAGLYLGDSSGALRASVKGETEIEVEELDYIEVRLAGEGGNRFVGWGEDPAHGLPVGSTLEEDKGVFHWLVGPGFLGRHVLHFAAGRGRFISPAVEVTITIRPKSYSDREGDKRQSEGRRSK